MLIFAILFAALPAATLLTIAIVQRRNSRQPVGLVITEYAPLPGANILFDAVLANADARALPAALVDLAIRKKIRLVAPQDPQPAEAQAPDAKRAKLSAAQLAVEIIPGAQFSASEQRVLAVFLGETSAERSVRRLSIDRGAVGGRAAALLADTIKDLAARGMIAAQTVRVPRRVCSACGWLGVVATVRGPGICGAVWSEDATAPAGVIVAALAFCATIAALVVCPGPWRRFLPPSLPARRHLEGMREYIRLAEADRLRVLQSPQGAVRTPASPGFERLHVYEQLLPYAILFKLEKEWAEMLRVEAAGIDLGSYGVGADGLLVASEMLEATLLIAFAAGHIAEAVGGAGQILDATGSVLEGIGDLLNF